MTTTEPITSRGLGDVPLVLRTPTTSPLFAQPAGPEPTWILVSRYVPPPPAMYQAPIGPENHPVEPAIVHAAGERVRQGGGVLSEAEMRAVLTAAGWPSDLHDQALAVARCESSWSPYAIGAGSYGLFQLWLGWLSYAGLSLDDWADPVTNARAALGAYRYSGGWGQWSCQPR